MKDNLQSLIDTFFCSVDIDKFYSQNQKEKLADWLRENGVIVPPCKVGDTVYCDGKYFASHCEGKIMSFPVNLIETKVSSIFRGEPDVCFDFEDFGKTAFLTREAAEQALKEVHVE